MTGLLGSGAGAVRPDSDPVDGRPEGRLWSLFDSHLGLDAVVAYVDGELGPVAFERACAHLLRCGQCAGEIAEQAAVARYLQAAGPPRMPGSLFDALTAIPLAVPADPVATGSIPGPLGRAVVSSPTARRPGHPAPGRRSRFGAGALVAGLAVGAAVATVATAGEHPPAPEPGVPHVRTVLLQAPVVSYHRH